MPDTDLKTMKSKYLADELYADARSKFYDIIESVSEELSDFKDMYGIKEITFYRGIMGELKIQVSYHPPLKVSSDIRTIVEIKKQIRFSELDRIAKFLKISEFKI